VPHDGQITITRPLINQAAIRMLDARLLTGHSPQLLLPEYNTCERACARLDWMIGYTRAQIPIAAGRIRGIDPDEVESPTTANARLASGGSLGRELGMVLAAEFLCWMFAPSDDRDGRRAPQHTLA
jgi:hypothetical protein